MVKIEKGFELDLSVLNYAKYIKNNLATRCPTTVEDVRVYTQITNKR